ncbi:MAG: hypothetical protein KJ914_10790 [Gammaproteobacteria bacterium]|nr:hypothetical protein [Gammaproteobacteria bacterium]MBU1723937.1 hypothetical protein [Gammaproteobacteria bacterium]MBU2006154.1 hypothetical protein [Gammaproteobacteria bacterium]
MNTKFVAIAFTAAMMAAGAAFAADETDMGKLSIMAEDQDVSAGAVTASKVMSDGNGWMVVHRTDEKLAPGSVIGYAPLKTGENNEVTALLTEAVEKGQMLMLMLHTEKDGMKPGIYEFGEGKGADSPVMQDGDMVTTTVTAK